VDQLKTLQQEKMLRLLTIILRREEPFKSCLIFLRQHILSAINIRGMEVWDAFLLLQRKRFCCIWVHNIVNLTLELLTEIIHHLTCLRRTEEMKIFLIDPDKDIPLRKSI
jgi:hypothetical protein